MGCLGSSLLGLLLESLGGQAWGLSQQVRGLMLEDAGTSLAPGSTESGLVLEALVMGLRRRSVGVDLNPGPSGTRTTEVGLVTRHVGAWILVSREPF